MGSRKIADPGAQPAKRYVGLQGNKPVNIKRLGERLSLDHHSQGIIFVLGIIFAVLKVWWSIPGLLLYSVMHFQYGGAGTFQDPPRGDLAHQTVVDFIYVGIGLIGIVTIVCGIVIRLSSLVM